MKKYRRTSLYARDRDSKNKLAYNKFTNEKNKDYHKLEDRFQKNKPFLNRIYAKLQIKRLHVARAACTSKTKSKISE